MPLGADIDANTVGAWAFDEPAEVPLANYATASDDGPNALDFVSVSNDPKIVGGKLPRELDDDGIVTSVDYARWFDDINDRLLDPNDIGATRANEIWANDGTIEAWIFKDQIGGGTQWIFSSDAISGGSNNNVLATLEIRTGGEIALFWQSGSKVSRSVISTGTIGAGVWTHVAAVWTLNGGNRDVEFFINGVTAGTGSALNGSGGQNTRMVIGATRGSTLWYGGKIAAIHVQLEALSAATLVTHAASARSVFAATANTWALFNFPEAPSVFDVGPHGLHLNPASLSNSSHSYGALPVRAGSASVRATGSSSGWYHPHNAAFVSTFQGSAEWTMELWISPQRVVTTSDRGLFAYFASGESDATNVLAFFVIARSSGDVGEVATENGPGVNSTATGTVDLITAANEYAAIYYAIAKEDNGDGTHDMLVYVNGALADTIGPLDDSTGGDATTALWSIMSANGAFSSTDMGGLLNYAHLSNIARSASYISDAYDAGILVGAPADTTPPVVANVLPAAGGPLLPTDAVSFDVTDETGLAAIIVAGYYPSDRTYDVIHDGTAFGFGYSGTRTPITDGYHYTITRDAGWLEFPQVRITAIDTGGNPAT